MKYLILIFLLIPLVEAKIEFTVQPVVDQGNTAISFTPVATDDVGFLYDPYEAEETAEDDTPYHNEKPRFNISKVPEVILESINFKPILLTAGFFILVMMITVVFLVAKVRNKEKPQKPPKPRDDIF